MDHKCLFTYFCFWDGYDDRQKPMGKFGQDAGPSYSFL